MESPAFGVPSPRPPADPWWARIIDGPPFWSSVGSLAPGPSAEETPSPRPAGLPGHAVDRARPQDGVKGNPIAAGGGTSTARPAGEVPANPADDADAHADDAHAGDAAAEHRDAVYRRSAAQNAPGSTSGCTPGAPGDAPKGASGDASGDVPDDVPSGAAGAASGAAVGGTSAAGSSSWVAVAAVGEAARVVALVPVPEDAGVCLAEAEELLAARDRITSALAARVGRVHRAGEAKGHGHASTKLWLRSAGGMTPAGAGRLVTMSVELHRLAEVRRLFAEGGLAEGVVEAICTATAGLTDDQAATAERILLELAKSAGAAEVAKAGRYLRAVLDPDGHEKDEQADFDRRFFRVRRRRGGGLEGEFYLPVEAAARLRHLLDVYAKPKAEGDDRPLSVRNADALIAFLENKIVTELLVLVNAESLPDDPASGTACDEGEPIIDDGEPTIEEPADGEPEPADEQSEGAEPGTRPSAVSPERTAIGPERAATVPPAGGDRSAGEDGCSTVAPSAGDDTSPAASPATSSAACRAASGAAAGAGAGAGACGGADGLEPVTGRAAAGSSPMDGPAAAWPHFDPTDSHEHGHERGDLRDCDDVEQDHADDPDADSDDDHANDSDDDSDDDPGTQEEGIERGHRRNRARPQQAPPQQTHAPDPPPEPDAPPDAEGSAWPGGDDWPGGGAWPGGDAWPGSDAWAGVGADAPPEADHSGEARQSGSAWPGGEAWPGLGGNVPPGVWLRGLPGLILATGHLLPVVSVHRLARTSTLVRIVMNAAGQVLDMGRKVRLATPAQRRAVFARYATCWVDGCPLPATMCQIDHAENWCSGGLTDLKLLGPACQFHNRDRYRHPTRYTRREIGDDRWAFAYRNPRTTRKRE
ncbi:HNH endonuclease [Microbispora sp. NBC_01189]|uniref:HNH endonuclease signature motif containing protein n=1 Tax=Microbispora sp. NBC_01189 TaxID=2903583 RepID=UPI002E0E2766|nr:HNH endonuclease [Microbispora sp. NBC_01189]